MFASLSMIRAILSSTDEKAKMSVQALGYVVVEASDVPAWTAFATERMGLMVAEAPDGHARFRSDEQSWRLGIEPGPLDDIVAAGFEVKGPAELAELEKRLRDAGIEVASADPAAAMQRGVADLVSCRDPDGLRLEFYHKPTVTLTPSFHSPAGVSGFVAGNEGMGHLVIGTDNIDAMRTFYTELLGFRLTDNIMMSFGGVDIDLEFYYCNTRHHTLALSPMKMPKRIHHLLLQVLELDDLGRALDRVAAAGDKMTVTLGRHSNDKNVTFYVQTPSGFEIEYGWGSPSVAPSQRHPVRWDNGSYWGHKWLG
jgi:2,3-dihydroxybiphenyl 1,2-dioxygenase